ncbi:Uncharacterised protein [Mycobacterium tuberculosis]|nr:Uncharacterised protein [Mycobacterium tuberculosis]CNM43331.1 Uncharacterised protein [Mycobacterium tuberculosis]CNU23554.1 Uncharacterised protein [Mycobacterium tuberculosis]COV08310.1 Uncharacterised protein [Mycobacterium tuberculosis]COV18005.1 Uncharacterised protein [Mycobacterium tuberculosis]
MAADFPRYTAARDGDKPVDWTRIRRSGNDGRRHRMLGSRFDSGGEAKHFLAISLAGA